VGGAWVDTALMLREVHGKVEETAPKCYEQLEGLGSPGQVGAEVCAVWSIFGPS